MYAWLWRHLPGGGPVKAATAAGMILVAVLLLWYVAFPWLETRIRFDHGVVNGTPAPAPSGSPSGGRDGGAESGGR